MDAGQTMLGHEVDIRRNRRDGVFAAEIARAVHLVMTSETPICTVLSGMSSMLACTGARRGYGKHAADAADQFAGFACLGRIPCGRSDASNRRTITHGFHSRIPVPLAHHLSGDA